MRVSIREIIAKTGDLPSMPELAMKVMRMLEDPNTNAKNLQDTISNDQSMTLQILKIANSALYGLKREVRTLSHAIMILGFNSIRSIVLASAAKNMYFSKTMGLKERLLWEKSIGCAMISRILGSKFSDINKEECFICGLMHNMGQTVLNQKFPAEYDQIIQESYMEGIPVEALEKRAFGFSHNELGGAITEKWNLSENISQVILFYLAPAMAPQPHRRLASVVNIAHSFCADLGVGVKEPVPVSFDFLRSSRDILDCPVELLEEWKEELAGLLEENAGVFTEL
ncbi:MAG: hypothetical protein CR997_10545 [Acidobacteria bacterium]|nr:MAG: hypothetical protein CR997_10545 [Acidobacteriota bacterium]